MARPFDPSQLTLWEPPPVSVHAPRRLAMPNAEVLYYTDFLPAHDAAAAFAAIRPIAPWSQDRRQMYERVVDVPRLIAWYGAETPWPEVLAGLRRRVEAATGYAFDKVLLNLYRDGRDSVAWHRDDVDRYGHDEIIASLSLGATRRFMFRPRPGGTGDRLALDLPAGSLLLMGPGTQRHWEHCVPKTSRDVGERINLTFRRTAGLGGAGG
jgi:alkylated DNA repair dioxygenase AlkB